MKIPKIYSIIVIFIALSVALVLLLIYPAFNDIKNGSLRILSDKTKALSIEAEAGELNTFKEKYKDYKLDFGKIDHLFVDAKNPIEFIRFLEKISLDSGLTVDINVVPLSATSTMNGFKIASFQIAAKGTIFGTRTFVEKLETSPYIVRVQTIAIKRQESINVNIISNNMDSTISIDVAVQ